MHVTIMTLNDINLTYNSYKFQRIIVLSLSPDSKSMIAQIKSICCLDNTNAKSIHNKWPLSRLLKKKTSGRNCTYKSLICYICDTHR